MHNLVQAPEHIFLVVYVMEHQRDKEIIPLVVAQLHVDVPVSKNHFLNLLSVRL